MTFLFFTTATNLVGDVSQDMLSLPASFKTVGLICGRRQRKRIENEKICILII